MKTTFSAPKSVMLRLITALAPLVATYAFFTGRPVIGFALLLAIAISAAFWVVGYQVTDGKLLISYPGRNKAWDLAKLLRIEVKPNAMEFSFRLLGTGLFSMVGLYYSPQLGWYRSYATNSKGTVVLYFSQHVVAVTPDDPEQFAESIRQASGKT